MATSVELETAGSVWKLHVKNGDQVTAGQLLFIMEVMKMEVPYEAPVDGVVGDVAIEEGAVVEEGLIAMTIG